MIFQLAPFNPNINGQYYDDFLHTLAINKYLSSSYDCILFNGYNNATNSHGIQDIYRVGIVNNIDLENKIAEITLDEHLQFITPDDYVIGFKYISNGRTNKDKENNIRLCIQQVEYACLILKEELNIKS